MTTWFKVSSFEFQVKRSDSKGEFEWKMRLDVFLSV